MQKNRVKVNIAGSSYIVLSEENEDYIRNISEDVDEKIKDIKKSSTDISSLMAAILTAMDFCDFYKKSESASAEFKKQNQNYINANESLRKENSELRKRLSEMEMKLQAISIKNINNSINRVIK